MKYIYISGKITNNPNWKEQFKVAEMKLKASGENNVIINPEYIGQELEKEIEHPTYKDYMQADLRTLLICNTIYMLSNWKESKGATLEHSIAEALGMEIIYEDSEN